MLPSRLILRRSMMNHLPSALECIARVAAILAIDEIRILESKVIEPNDHTLLDKLVGMTGDNKPTIILTNGLSFHTTDVWQPERTNVVCLTLRKASRAGQATFWWHPRNRKFTEGSTDSFSGRNLFPEFIAHCIQLQQTKLNLMYHLICHARTESAWRQRAVALIKEQLGIQVGQRSEFGTGGANEQVRRGFEELCTLHRHMPTVVIYPPTKIYCDITQWSSTHHMLLFRRFITTPGEDVVMKVTYHGRHWWSDGRADSDEALFQDWLNHHATALMKIA